MSQYSISVPPKEKEKVAEGLQILEDETGLGKSELFRRMAISDLYNLKQLQQFTGKESLKTKQGKYIVIVV
jgi:hypothetical protein